MIPLHELPRPAGKARPRLARARRLLAYVTRSRRRAAALSWIAWLLCVAAYALWTLDHYQVPGAVPWIGMTIRAGAFAGWLLVAREWLMIQLQRRQDMARNRAHTTQE